MSSTIAEVAVNMEAPKRPHFLLRAWDAYERGLGKVVAAASAGNRALGQWTSRRPVLLILSTLVLSIGICVGWVRFRLEEDSDVLWVPQHGKATDDKDYVESYYPKSQQGASFYASLQPSYQQAYGGNNALQVPVTWEMFQLHNAVMALRVTGDDGTSVGFSDLCYKTRAGSCSRDGYLNFWGYSFNAFLASINGSATDPSVGNQEAFRTQVSQLTYPDGNAVAVLSVFGGTTFQFTPSFRLAAAQVIASDYTLDSSVSKSTAKDWHDAFKDLMNAKMPSLQYTSIVFITGSTVGEELGKAINGDMYLIIISFIVFIFLALLFLSRTDSVATRTSLALLGVLTVSLGIMAGWGWGFIFGLPFTPLQQLSPFILLGMGIDVIFIVVKAYDIIIHREPSLTLEQAFGQLMATAGLSIQVTLVASAVAFALGAVCNLNSVKWFSAFAALNTAMICLLMSTMFTAFFVLTERRVAAGRRDCCCCKPCARTTAAPGSTPSPNPDADPSSMEMGRDPPSSIAPMQENFVKRLFRVYYAPALTRWWVKVIVILVFIAYAIVSFFGIYHVKYGQPLSDLAPDGSYLVDYDSMFQNTYAKQVGQPTGLYFRSMDFSDPVVQGKMLASLDQMLGNQYINASTSGFQGNWYIAFNQYAASRTAMVQAPGCTNPYYLRATGSLAAVINPTPLAQQISGCVPQDQFYPLLSSFLTTPKYQGYNNDIVRSASSGGSIVTARFTVMQVAPGDDDKFTSEFIRSMRDLEDDINSGVLGAQRDAAGTDVAFTYNSNYVFYEGDEMLPNMALEYFLLALAGVGFVVLFMLVNPWTALLIMCSVGLVDLFLFGELWMMSIRFNQVSVINMIMATGLAVDYTVYFAQKFMVVSADGTLNGRMQLALADTGSAVFLGGFTALCGAVPMAFSKSVIIRTFFNLIFGTIIFSLATGLILMPVVLSLVGPPPVRSVLVLPDEGDKEAEGKAGKEVEMNSSEVARGKLYSSEAYGSNVDVVASVDGKV